MAGARIGARLSMAPGSRNLPVRIIQHVRKWKSTGASAEPTDLRDLECTTTFTTPAPDQSVIDAFKASRSSIPTDRKLPGNRYQYHPPKYNRGRLHPVQPPPSSDPTARNFEPGPFGFPRLKHTYDSTIAPDLMTLTYNHVPPGAPPSRSQKGTLREWEGSSPYLKNRPRPLPRGGGSPRLCLLERDISWNNIPEIEAVSVHSFASKAPKNKEYLQVALAIVQAITGRFPEVTCVNNSVAQWGIKTGDRTGVKAKIRGGAAFEFVDKLVTIVLPKIKNWPGIRGSSGDRTGNVALGLEPEAMAYFPELEFNYDMYPAKLIPGCNIYIQTTGTSNRQGRLLLSALGFPFYGQLSD